MATIVMVLIGKAAWPRIVPVPKTLESNLCMATSRLKMLL
jgi:hypothetical protein